jgi:ATP-dependent Clp protease ATP-binding subunit ClpA
MIEPDRIAHLRGLDAHLRANLRGQDHLLPRVAAAFARAALAIPDAEKPGASLLLVGPTGTGKTETFGCACEYVYGRDRMKTFDMSEYQDRSAVNKLLGENREDPGLLGRALAALRSGGLLFDELEKAHPLVLDLFLQILWRGCITVATGETFALGPYVVGFTSNLGAAEAMRMAHSRFASIEQAVLRRVELSLRPEFIGRLDEKLVFARLGPDVQREICALEVARETKRLRGLGYDLEVSHQALEFLIVEGFHPNFGARPLRKAVERQLQDAVVRELLAAGRGAGLLVPDQASRRLVIQRALMA